MRVVIHSKTGRSVVAVLGILYFASATATLVYYVATNWSANGLTDYALQLALAASAFGGIILFLIGTDGLRLRRERPNSHSTPDHHKTATAVL